MVGTIEPRKGHRFVLAAMEELWRNGNETQLVIVGKEGWRSHDITRSISENPRLGKRLFWLPRASDELLEQLYAQASALVAASANEGFGLPLVEAAQHGLPIIARDIPVFREVAGDHAFYFSDDRPVPLASTFTRWFALAYQNRAPSSRPMPILRWADSAAQVVSAIIGDRWDHVWSPSAEWRKVL